MTIIDRINYQATQMGNSAKAGIQSLLLITCKIISGLILGLTFALVGQVLMGFGPIPFWFVIFVSMAAFYRISKPWGPIGLLIFDLLCILAALLIRMYVIVAPG